MDREQIMLLLFRQFHQNFNTDKINQRCHNEYQTQMICSKCFDNPFFFSENAKINISPYAFVQAKLSIMKNTTCSILLVKKKRKPKSCYHASINMVNYLKSIGQNVAFCIFKKKKWFIEMTDALQAVNISIDILNLFVKDTDLLKLSKNIKVLTSCVHGQLQYLSARDDIFCLT